MSWGVGGAGGGRCFLTTDSHTQRRQLRDFLLPESRGWYVTKAGWVPAPAPSSSSLLGTRASLGALAETQALDCGRGRCTSQPRSPGRPRCSLSTFRKALWRTLCFLRRCRVQDVQFRSFLEGIS